MKAKDPNFNKKGQKKLFENLGLVSNIFTANGEPS